MASSSPLRPVSYDGEENFTSNDSWREYIKLVYEVLEDAKTLRNERDQPLKQCNRCGRWFQITFGQVYDDDKKIVHVKLLDDPKGGDIFFHKIWKYFGR